MYCQCGCGKITSVIDSSCKKRGLVKGEYHKFIHGHQPKSNGKDHPSWKGGTTKKNGYIYVSLPSHPRATKSGHVAEHILAAEESLGKSLPLRAVVHHIDGDQANNEKSNLVICENNKYHLLLHKRERALKACGHADWLKCKYCKLHDDPEKMYVPKGKIGAYHAECKRVFNPSR